MKTGSQMVRQLLHPLYRTLETRVHPLRYLFIELTQRCNLNCRHCGSDCSKDTQLDELTTEQWLELFAYLPRHFDRRKLLLVLTGGEPLCCPRFSDILAGLRKNRLLWGMVTNGWALTDRRLATLMAHGLASITISLDGERDSHDWLRGVPGSFDRAFAAMRRVGRGGIPFADVVTCVNPRNLEQLPAVLALLRDAGLRAWRLFSIFPKGRAKGDPELQLSQEQSRKLLDWIAQERKALRGDDFSLQLSCEGYLDGRLDAAVRDDPYFCRAGISIGSVLCDGSISGCPNITRSLIQGNIRTDDLKTVWESRFEPLRNRSWMQRGRCDACVEWRRCQGNSLHLWDDEAQQTSRCYVGAGAG